MDRRACCAKEGVKRGAWTATEDRMLASYIEAHGEGRWREAPQRAGLRRCGKSCRLRWLNYLRPNIKRGNISDDEEELIIRLHNLLGNRWSLIAGRLPGRTDNEIKNYWNSTLGKKAGAGAGGKQGVAAANHAAGSGPARAGPADAGVGGKQGVAAANHTAASGPAGAGPTDASASTGAEAAPAVCAPKAVRCTGGFFFRPETPPPGARAETVRVTGNDCSGGSGLSFAEPFFSGDDWMEDVRALASFLECEEEWV